MPSNWRWASRLRSVPPSALLFCNSTGCCRRASFRSPGRFHASSSPDCFSYEDSLHWEEAISSAMLCARPCNSSSANKNPPRAPRQRPAKNGKIYIQTIPEMGNCPDITQVTDSPCRLSQECRLGTECSRTGIVCRLLAECCLKAIRKQIFCPHTKCCLRSISALLQSASTGFSRCRPKRTP